MKDIIGLTEFVKTEKGITKITLEDLMDFLPEYELWKKRNQQLFFLYIVVNSKIMELIKIVYKHHRIIEFENNSKTYVSTFKIVNSAGKCLIRQKARNSIICLNYCKKLIDKMFT